MFKKQIPAEAQQLAVKFCQVLQPLFAQLNYKPKTTLCINSSVSTDDLGSLQEIFKIALQVKAYLVLSTNTYEAVMYSPGTLFSKTRMEARNTRGMREENPSQQKPQTKCCYLPALIEHQRSNDVVDSNNFIQSDPVSRWKLKPFSKALVLV
jgi:hypothetical protein